MPRQLISTSIRPSVPTTSSTRGSIAPGSPRSAGKEAALPPSRVMSWATVASLAAPRSAERQQPPVDLAYPELTGRALVRPRHRRASRRGNEPLAPQQAPQPGSQGGSDLAPAPDRLALLVDLLRALPVAPPAQRA